jgi:hypothetical protein
MKTVKNRRGPNYSIRLNFGWMYGQVTEAAGTWAPVSFVERNWG